MDESQGKAAMQVLVDGMSNEVLRKTVAKAIQDDGDLFSSILGNTVNLEPKVRKARKPRALKDPADPQTQG